MDSGAKHRQPHTTLAAIGGSLLMSWLLFPVMLLLAALTAGVATSEIYTAAGLFTGAVAPLISSMIGRHINSRLMHVVAMFQLGISVGLAAAIVIARAA